MGIQVCVDTHAGPTNSCKSMVEPGPGVCPALTLAVEPFEQDALRMMDIPVTGFRVIRDGVVV